MERGYEEWGVVATIDPKDQNGVTDALSDAVDMSKWSQIMCVINLGVLASTSVGTIFLKDSPTSGGSYTPISGKTVTTADTQSGQVIIIALDAIQVNPGAQFVKADLTFNAHSALVSVLILGKAVDLPATDNDLADVQPVIP